MTAIGAQSTYSECPTGPYAKIVGTGDEARSFLEPLSQVVQSGVNVLIWAGDLDWICNWVSSASSVGRQPGGPRPFVHFQECTTPKSRIQAKDEQFGSQLVVNNLNYSGATSFQSTELSEYTVGGKSYGQFKSVDNLNFLRVYEAGHEVPYYRKLLVEHHPLRQDSP